MLAYRKYAGSPALVTPHYKRQTLALNGVSYRRVHCICIIRSLSFLAEDSLVLACDTIQIWPATWLHFLHEIVVICSIQSFQLYNLGQHHIQQCSVASFVYSKFQYLESINIYVTLHEYWPEVTHSTWIFLEFSNNMSRVLLLFMQLQNYTS